MPDAVPHVLTVELVRKAGGTVNGFYTHGGRGYPEVGDQIRVKDSLDPRTTRVVRVILVTPGERVEVHAVEV